MLKTYLRHLYRDRYRLILVIFLAQATVYVAGDSLPGALLDVPTAILVVALVLVAVPFIAIRFRRYRHWIEIVVLGDLIYAALARALPGSPFDYVNLDGPLVLNTIAWVFTLIATRGLIYGKWSDRFTPDATASVTTRFRSTASVEALWYGLVPTPGHLSQLAEPDVVSVDYADTAHRTVRVVLWHPPSDQQVMLMHIDEIQPLKRLKMRLEVIEGLRDAAVEAASETEIIDRGNHRQIVMRFSGPMMAPRKMLRGLLDDPAGRMFDLRIAAIERGKVVNGRLQLCDRFTAWFDEATPVPPVPDPRRRARAAPAHELSRAEQAVRAAGVPASHRI